MSAGEGGVSLARREWRRLSMLWALLSVMAAVAGPFGTMAALGPLPRFLYWAGVIGGAIGCSVIFIGFAQGRRVIQKCLIWTVFSITLASLIHLLNIAVFDSWGGAAQWGYLLGVVGLVTFFIQSVIAMLEARGQRGTGEPDLVFQRRLPPGVRGRVQRIEAQDHYLNVVTDRGSALILMRLSDALDALSDARGLQVHRSHWVAFAAVQGHRRVKGRDLLVMPDGANVPVSRSFRAAARDAGLF